MDNQRRQELAVQRALAMEVVKPYCEKNGLSITKLNKQRFIIINSLAAFGQPSDVVPNGLLNDLDTQPKPTLVLKLADGKILIEETEYTRKYLSME